MGGILSLSLACSLPRCHSQRMARMLVVFVPIFRALNIHCTERRALTPTSTLLLLLVPEMGGQQRGGGGAARESRAGCKQWTMISFHRMLPNTLGREFMAGSRCCINIYMRERVHELKHARQRCGLLCWRIDRGTRLFWM